MLSIKHFHLGFVFVCVSLVTLNPYTLYGRPGVFIAMILAVYGVCNGLKKKFAIMFLVPSLALLLIGSIGVVSSVFNDIFQLNHLLSVISFVAMLFAAYGLWVYCEKVGISKNDVIKIVMYAIVLNSMIIVLELKYESLRLFIESFFDPLEKGSINYASGYRFRGLASSGGAGLSVSVPAALTISLYLFSRKMLSFPILLLIIVILEFSVLVIGRTGLVLSVVPLAAYMVFAFKQQKIFRTLVVVIALLPIMVLLYQFSAGYFTEIYGEHFVKYAVGFLFDGLEGIEEEGTVSVMVEFLTVLPLEFPQVLFGYGFYGGSDFFPWTDSGYSRIFLSVGFLFGFIFYAIIFRIYFMAFKGNEFLVGTFIFLLAVAEIKEPMLFNGVAARMFVIILVFCWFEKYQSFKLNRLAYSPLFSSDNRASMNSQVP